jgi:hypothetical protein
MALKHLALAVSCVWVTVVLGCCRPVDDRLVEAAAKGGQ